MNNNKIQAFLSTAKVSSRMKLYCTALLFLSTQLALAQNFCAELDPSKAKTEFEREFLLTQQADCFVAHGDYFAASALYAEAAILVKRRTHPDSIPRARMLFLLQKQADCLRVRSEFGAAKQLLSEAYEMVKLMNKGAKSPLSRAIEAQQAQVLLDEGRRAEALKKFGQLNEKIAKDLGEESPLYGRFLLQLARAQLWMGDPQSAAETAAKAKSFLQADAYLPNCQILQTEIWSAMSNFEPAAQTLSDLQGELARQLKPDLRTAEGLLALSNAFSLLSEPEMAIHSARQAFRIVQNIGNANHVFPTAAVQLAVLLQESGKADTAATYFELALQATRSRRDSVRAFIGLATIELAANRFGAAQQLFEQAQSARDLYYKNPLPEDFAIGFGHASCELGFAHDQEAERLLRHWTDRIKAAYGIGHARFSVGMTSLAGLLEKRGDLDTALACLRAAREGLRLQTTRSFAVLTENGKVNFLTQTLPQIEAFQSFYFRNQQALAPAEAKRLPGEIYDMLLQVKMLGVESIAEARRQQTIDKTGQTRGVNTLLISWERIQQKMPYASPSELPELLAIADSLERKMAGESPIFRVLGKGRSWNEVAGNLPGGAEAVVEFFHFRYLDHDKWRDQFAAIVLNRSEHESPRFVELFEAEKLRALLRTIETQKDASTAAKHLYKYKGAQLFEMVWRPLLPALGKARRIFIAPCDLLYGISFAAIPMPDGRLLLDAYEQIWHVNSSAELDVRSNPYPSAINTALVLGRVEGDLQPSGSDVEATVAELSNQGIIVGQATSCQATESFVSIFFSASNSRPKPHLLHVDTHGLWDSCGASPMHCARLALSVCKTPLENSPDDGFWRADEIAILNFFETILVTISACKSGAGAAHATEGLFGLQRAFKLGGAKHTIVALSNVDASATAEFMQLFYRSWFSEKIPLHDAFTTTQQALKNKYPDDPCRWASFVLY